MPHEKITRGENQLVVEWNSIGWVQVAIYPEGWSDTGDATHVPVNPQRLALLIKTLKRAQRQAYRRGGLRHSGFEDEAGKVETQPLFRPRKLR